MFKKILNKLFFLSLASLSASHTLAAGTLSLNGKLGEQNPKEIEVFDGRKTYMIIKNKLDPLQLSRVSKLKKGEKVTIQISFDSIDHVR